ncbi:hypothetical protein IIA79_07720, partial [bacterium]|nr:hypothetical protein [bacterium]
MTRKKDNKRKIEIAVEDKRQRGAHAEDAGAPADETLPGSTAEAGGGTEE